MVCYICGLCRRIGTMESGEYQLIKYTDSSSMLKAARRYQKIEIDRRREEQGKPFSSKSWSDPYTP